MPERRAIYVVVDVDEVPDRAFMNRQAALEFVATTPGTHILEIPLDALGGDDDAS